MFKEKPWSGTTYIIFSGLTFTIVNLCIHYIKNIPPHEITFFRSIFTLFFTYTVLKKMKLAPFGNNKPMLILRGVMGTLFQLLFFWTLQQMPLASATAIHYINPILTVILSAFMLKEYPNMKQWLLFVLSFVGVLLIKGIDPRVTAFGATLGFLSALAAAYAYTLIRKLRKEDHALVVMFYLPLVGVILMGPWTLTHWVQPIGMDWIILLIVAIMTQIGQYFLTMAYQVDTAANVANYNYLNIAYSVIIGLLVFGEKLDFLAIIGMVVIAASALFSSYVKPKEAAVIAPKA